MSIKSIKVEAESNELLMRNSYGDIIIIPANKRKLVEDKLKDGCHKCIDDIATKLPKYESYAEDGGQYDVGEPTYTGIKYFFHDLKNRVPFGTSKEDSKVMDEMLDVAFYNPMNERTIDTGQQDYGGNNEEDDDVDIVDAADYLSMRDEIQNFGNSKDNTNALNDYLSSIGEEYDDNDRNNDVSNIDTDVMRDVLEAKGFVQTILNSEWHKQRLMANAKEFYKDKNNDDKFIEDTVKKYIDNEKIMLNNTVERGENVPSRTNRLRTTNVVGDKNTMFLPTNEAENKRVSSEYSGYSTIPSTAAHEYSHSIKSGGRDIEFYLDGNSQDSKIMSNAIKPDMEDNYVSDFEEGSSDIMSIRYIGWKNGLFNPHTGKWKTKSGNINSDIIKRISTKDKFFTKRMLETYGEEGLIELINKIVSSDIQDIDDDINNKTQLG